ncbi:MAG TPA: glyoxalase superfamily protein [Ramlibacter sp.]|nr:glyoxalase superfamily protein [Ramlibacter sp.]
MAPAAGRQATPPVAALGFGRVTPILRIFDEARAREFYLEFLGFRIDWEHRFQPDLPLYLQVSRGGCVLHLSEHHGDGSPGVAVRIEVDRVDALHQELAARRYRYARPDVEATAWGTRELTVRDPFGNRLVFWTR